MIFRIINKSNNDVKYSRAPKGVGAFMLGRRVDNYIIVKTDLPDDTNPRIVELRGGDVRGVMQACEDA